MIYPNIPHPGVTDTSRQAAESILARSANLQDRVFDVIKERPSTADEVAEALGESVLSVRPRVSELRALNKVAPTTARRNNRFGRSQIVWSANPEQRKMF